MFLQSLVRWLRQPYPLFHGSRWGFRVAFFSGLFVTLFLFFLQPFGTRISEGQEWHWLRIAAEFGAITMAVTLAWGLIERLSPQIFNEENWRVWKDLVATLFFVSLIATANMLYAAWRFGFMLSWRSFGYWQFMTWAVGIFPTLYGVFSKQMRLMRRYSAEAAALSAHLPHPEHAPAPAITLTGENQGESLTLPPDCLLYLAAADNYVQVCFRENGQIRNRLLRGALRRMEEALSVRPEFFRCHRTFLVNLDQVVRVSGNAQGYKLHFEGTDAAVPVSRALNDAVRARLATQQAT